MKRMIAGSLSQPSRFLKIFHLKVVFILFILSSHSLVFSQSSRPLADLPIDTLKVGAISDSVISFADKIQKLADNGYLESKADYEATKEINHREAVIDEIISTI